MKKRSLSAIAITAALLLSACGNVLTGDVGAADTWPSRNIQIIVPFGAGGDTDFNARAYAGYLEEDLGTTVTVVNIEGNGGATGTAEAARAAADGYTALFFHAALLVNEVSGASDIGIDDFEYVATAASSPGDIIAVRSDSGFTDLPSLIEYSTQHPGELKVAADVGATTHVIALQLQQAGANVNIVSSGGSSDRTAALVGGHVDVIINPYGTIADYLNNGDFTALANVRPERAEGFSDIPTATEQGVPQINWTNHYFLALPAGTPQEIVDAFADAMEKVNQREDYRTDIFEAYRQEPVFGRTDQGLADLQRTRETVIQFEDEFRG
ncbi:tripartite tricarboxylate transporter substrate binding protein [Pseudonocardia sichuanensis]